MTDLERMKEEWLTQIATTHKLEELTALRVAALGKKGALTLLLKELAALPPEEKRAFGAQLNAIKETLALAFEARQAALEEAMLAQKIAAGRIDISLPPPPSLEGSLHPIGQTIDEVCAIFGEMGFIVAEGPDIEDDHHNFTALNFPVGHPARDMHDTFYLPEMEGKDRILLRTHTSPVQIRAMKRLKPPLRLIAPGRTYRCDMDMTHSPMFHQVEGLVIEKAIHMGHLKGVLAQFCESFFALSILPMRFRPSFFPFTEPSAEVDIQCDRSGHRLQLGTGTDWLEIAGCGMVHPNVLRNCGLDPEEWQGFAFGMGIERIAMLKYGIPDLRDFFQSDLRWLRHYGFRPLDLPTLLEGLMR